MIVGRIFLAPVAPEGRPWMWASSHNGDIKRAAHGYEPTREAAMAAFAKSWRRERNGLQWELKGLSMSTTVLAYLILMMGFLTFLAGLWGVLILIFEELAKTERVPFRYYAVMVGLISGGLAMIGIGQGLRLLLLILGKGVTVP